MSPDDPRHGTTAGHLAHRVAGEPACAACVAAKSRYEKVRNLYGPRMVPALGTRRRIRALKALGHSGADIAQRLGCTYQAVHKLENGTAAKVFATTAANVAKVYDEMSMLLPVGYHRTRIRNAAAARGYAPPLCWDDIDNDPEPKGMRHQDRRDLLADWADLRAAGESIEHAAARLGVTVGAIERAEFRAKKGTAA